MLWFQSSLILLAPNLLQQDFTAEAANQKWVSDITYIWTEEGWLYLAVVLDLYSRRVVGWAMSERMTASLVCDALTMALWRRQMPPVLIGAASIAPPSISDCCGTTGCCAA